MNNTLEFLLKKNNLTKSQLARDLGITRQTVVNVAKGRTPSMRVALLIADYFNKDVNEIFFDPNVKQVAQPKKKHTA